MFPGLSIQDMEKYILDLCQLDMRNVSEREVANNILVMTNRKYGIEFPSLGNRSKNTLTKIFFSGRWEWCLWYNCGDDQWIWFRLIWRTLFEYMFCSFNHLLLTNLRIVSIWLKYSKEFYLPKVISTILILNFELTKGKSIIKWQQVWDKQQLHGSCCLCNLN